MRVTTYDDLDIAVMELQGPLVGGPPVDALKAEALDLLEQGNRKLVVDLGGVTYLNSLGMGVLLMLVGSYTERRGRVKLCGLSRHANNLLVLTRLTELFEIEATREAALAAFRAPDGVPQ